MSDEDPVEGITGPGLVQGGLDVLELQDHGRRDPKLVLVQQRLDGSWKEVHPAGEQSGGDVRVQVDQGRHSSDQSM